MLLLYPALLLLNCLTEYLLNKMMTAMEVLHKKNSIYHAICAILRIIWIFLGAWYALPIPVLLTGLLILLFFNVIPYPDHRLLLNNFTMILYLIYASILMTVIGCAGLLGVDTAYMTQTAPLRIVILNMTFIGFNILCLFLLRYHPDFLWKEDYDKSKVKIYTHFLSICAVYHVLDAVILTLYQISPVNYFLLVGGDILILILMFNYQRYNFVFAKSEELRKEYEESQILMAQQYFEKEALKKLSETDSLTNTYNRREISSIMLENIQNGHELGCVFIDIDGLKRTNDKYGHSFGDLMLKRFADACLELLQGKGYLARVGGDEFLLVFPDQDFCTIDACIKELQLKLLEPADEKEKISFSYGISFGENSVDKYIIMADQRMYTDKSRKRRGDL